MCAEDRQVKGWGVVRQASVEEPDEAEIRGWATAKNVVNAANRLGAVRGPSEGLSLEVVEEHLVVQKKEPQKNVSFVRRSKSIDKKQVSNQG